MCQWKGHTMLNGELSTCFNKLMWFCNGNTSFGYRPARRGKASGQRVTSAIVAQPRWLTVRIVWPRSRRWHSVPTAAPRRLCQLRWNLENLQILWVKWVEWWIHPARVFPQYGSLSGATISLLSDFPQHQQLSQKIHFRIGTSKIPRILSSV